MKTSYMIKPKVMPTGEDGEMYTIAQFRELVNDGIATSDDGVGYYGNEQYYDLTACVWRGIEPHGATHVAWFSK